MEGYISIKQIADDLLEHPMLKDLNFERIINHTIHFMRKVGAPKSFIEKVAELQIDDYRALLPCDFYKMIQVKNNKGVYRYTSDSFHLEKPTLHNHERYINECHHPKHNHDEFTYKIQGNVIFTSNKKGKLTISYLALPLDENGFPLIKDNSPYIEALQAYIKEKQFTILFDQGKINIQILENAKREYAWAVGQAQTSLIMPSIDEMESITNMLTTLIPKVTQHSKGMKYLGTKEYIRRH